MGIKFSCSVKSCSFIDEFSFQAEKIRIKAQNNSLIKTNPFPDIHLAKSIETFSKCLILFDPIQDDPFRGCSRVERGAKSPPH